jgi:hypothetical protein
MRAALRPSPRRAIVLDGAERIPMKSMLCLLAVIAASACAPPSVVAHFNAVGVYVP